MEYALPELLSRDDILTILNKRHLQLNNLNELTHEELLRVYKTFVMPLSQRPERLKRNRNHVKSSIGKSYDYDEEMQVDSVDTMDIDFTHLTAYNGNDLSTNIRTASPVAEKRRQRSYDGDEDIEAIEKDYQYQLSSVTKRIRINTLS